MYRFAYHIPEVSDLMAASLHPKMQRLLRAWPAMPDSPDGVMIQAHPVQGVLVVWPRYDGTGVSLDQFGTPRPTHDGMTYYPSLEAPTREDVIRPEILRGPGVWVPLAMGGSLWVSLALATPRKLLMRIGKAMEHGAYATEYGILGHEIYQGFIESKDIGDNDPRVGRLFFLMQQASYYRTEEMAEDDSWVTSADELPILFAIWGLDPKALTAAPVGSPSVAPITETLN